MINSNPGDEVVKKEISNLKKVLSKHYRQEEENGERPIPKSVKDRIEEFKSRLAWLLLEIREYQEALEIYRSLSWKKYGEEKYIGTTRALTDLREYTEAGKLLARGLKRFPDSSPLLVARGLLNFRLGDSYEALQDFSRAVELTPDNSYALYDKALALNDLGYNLEASEILSNLVKEHPDDDKLKILLQEINDDESRKGMKSRWQMTGLYVFLSLILKKLSRYRAQSITKKIAGGLHTFLTILS